MFSKKAQLLKRIIARATPQVRRPFYIGCAVGGALLALVVLGFWNTSRWTDMPSALGGIAVSQAVWGLKPSNLLMVLPVGAFLVVLARSFVGVKAFGLFTPMLIALAFLQIGPVFGPVVLGTSVLAGMLMAPALLKLRMTRVGFLGVLISLVVLILVALQTILDRNLQVDAFPVVVCALVVERWRKTWEKDGWWPSVWHAGSTFLVSLIITYVMVSPVALAVINFSPLLMPAFMAVAIAVLGRYRGLRLSELIRFAPIWLEGRRNANANANPLASGQDPGTENTGLDPGGGEPPGDIADLLVNNGVGAPEAAGAESASAGPDSGDQLAERDHREIQRPASDRAGPRQGRRESGPGRTRHRHHRYDSRYLQLWGTR